MWNNEALLSTISGWCLWISAITGTIAAISGLISGITANRASDLATEIAEVRIANANRAAAEANLATAKLWKEVSWRYMDNNAFGRLVSYLSDQSPGNPWLTYVGSDPECQLFRNQLNQAFNQAGWQTKHFSGWEVAAGLSVAGNDSDEKRAIEAGFRHAGLEYTSEPPGEFFPNDTVIIVGTRPPPRFPWPPRS